MEFILISDRKVGNDFRGRIVSGEAKPAEHNGHIWSRASTKHGAILPGKNPRFLLDLSMSRRLRPWETAALLALWLFSGVWAQGRQQAVSRKLLRLHVIAVSDEEQEQELKLRVRDAVLDYLRPLLADTTDAGEARLLLEENLPAVARAAFAAAEGRQVTVSLGEERYPSRRYEGFTLPAGRYDSLRVVLGEGQGHNWWCIVFPPLCLEAVQTEQVQEVMSREDFALVTEEEGYELRFRLVELWGELVNKLEIARGK